MNTPTIDDHYVAISAALDAMLDARSKLGDAVLLPAIGPVESLAKIIASRISGEVHRLVAELGQVQAIVTEASRNAQ